MHLVVLRRAALYGAVVFLSLGVISSRGSTNIAGIFATGAGGTNGAADLHYKLITEPVGAPTNAIISSILPSSWVTAPLGSKWLSPFQNANQSAPAGTYIFSLSFNLVDVSGHALNPNTASLSGKFAGDDFVEVKLNGITIASASTNAGISAFERLFSFSANSGFVAGVNTLEFDVCNLGCDASPTGILVTDFCTTADVMPVPEPGTWAILAFGLVTLLVIRPKAKRVRALVPIKQQRRSRQS